MKKEEIPAGFKLMRVYFILLALLNLRGLFIGIKTLTTLLVLIIIGVIVFGINKRRKFGQYAIYITVVYSVLSGLISIIVILSPIMLQEFAATNPYISNISNVLYSSLLILLVQIIINGIIFYYTYKHRKYFIN